jgi:hypothetical protein
MNTALPEAARILNGGFRLDVATTPLLFFPSATALTSGGLLGRRL